jgi:hypothetical protein
MVEIHLVSLYFLFSGKAVFFNDRVYVLLDDPCADEIWGIYIGIWMRFVESLTTFYQGFIAVNK